MRNPWLRFAAGIVLLAGNNPVLPAADATVQGEESAEDIYRRIFGEKEALPGEMECDFKIAGYNSGQLRIMTDGTNITHVQRDILLQKLETYLKPGTYQKLAKTGAKQEWLDRQQLKGAGINAKYDGMDLSVDIEINRQSLNRRMRSLLSALPGQGRVIPENLAEPATVSGYINLYSGASYDGQSYSNPVRFNLRTESTLNINGFVLESQHTYQAGNNKNRLVRDRTRLVIDDAENEYRYQLGDINTQGRNFQNQIELGGIQLIQDLIWANPQEYHPQGNPSFKLESDAEIEVYQDGNLTRTTRLPAGEHTLADVDATQGNEIELKIRDDFGNMATRNFSRFSDSRLLSPDFSKYAISAGFPSQRQTDVIHYDTKRPIASAYYQQGVTETLTAGIDAQTDGKAYQIGADSILATPLGNLTTSISQSQNRHDKNGTAIRLQLTSPEPGILSKRHPPSWNLATEQFSEDFQPFSPYNSELSDSSPKRKRSLNAGFNLPLTQQASLNISGSRSQYFNASPSQTSSMGFNTSLGKHLGFSLNGTTRRDSDGKTERTMGISLNMNLDPVPSGRSQSLNGTSTNTTNKENESRLTYRLGNNGNFGSDSLTGSVKLESRGNVTATGVEMRWKETTGEFNAAIQPSFSENKADYYSQISANTAVVFADGAFGISRPVQDSFAIMEAPEGLEYPMAVKRGKSIFERKTNSLDTLPESYDGIMLPSGKAVLPNIYAYQVQHVSTDSAVLPDTLDLNATEFDLMPDYKSGYLLRVGGKPGVSLQLSLRDNHSKPVALEGGQLTLEGNTPTTTIKFFTDENGIANISPLQPGNYQLELFSRPDNPALNLQVTSEPGQTQTLELKVP